MKRAYNGVTSQNQEQAKQRRTAAGATSEESNNVDPISAIEVKAANLRLIRTQIQSLDNLLLQQHHQFIKIVDDISYMNQILAIYSAKERQRDSTSLTTFDNAKRMHYSISLMTDILNWFQLDQAYHTLLTNRACLHASLAQYTSSFYTMSLPEWRCTNTADITDTLRSNCTLVMSCILRLQAAQSVDYDMSEIKQYIASSVSNLSFMQQSVKNLFPELLETVSGLNTMLTCYANPNLSNLLTGSARPPLSTPEANVNSEAVVDSTSSGVMADAKAEAAENVTVTQAWH